MRGIGIDLCEVERMERIMQQTPGFLTKHYTEEERAYIQARGQAGAQSAAAMFAAKEAFLKALGTGLGGVAMREIGVAHDASGAPSYALSDAALEKLRLKGASQAWLSLTHEAGVAAAVCVIE